MTTIKTKTRAASETPAPARSTHVFPKTAPGSAELPLVKTAAQLAANEGKKVRLQGTYIEVDARRHRVGPPQHIGFVKIILEDLTRVMLLATWEEDALRPKSEVETYNKTKVEVVGTLYGEAPPDPEGGAMQQSPCITDVQALQKVPVP